MTQAIESSLPIDEPRRMRVHLPTLPAWVVPRPRVADRLDLGGSGVLTLVTGPTGGGKTVAVASWARRADVPKLVWLSLATAGSDPDVFWERLRDALHQAGERHLAPIPEVGARGRRRLHALTTWGLRLRRTGPWTLVLDDFPTGPTAALGKDLEAVLEAAQRQVRLVVISRGEPAIEIQRRQVAGELTWIDGTDLAMDPDEVGGVLARHGVVAGDLAARAVEWHTQGWPCGVRLAAVALRGAPTIEAALATADQAAIEFLGAEVLAKLPREVRELIVRTCWLDEVSPQLARAALGDRSEVRIDAAVASGAFVDLNSDGSFRCHPLLRAAARAELAREPEASVRDARRRTAHACMDAGDVDRGLSLVLEAQDWAWAGRMLVESYAVPRILAGSSGEVAESALSVAAVVDAQPLLRAALGLRRGNLDASAALLGQGAGRDGLRPGTAEGISAVILGLYAARLRGDTVTGLALAREAREQIADLPAGLHDELMVMVDAHEGAVQVSGGALHEAAPMLRHGAMSGAMSGAQTSGAACAALDCQGQLALLEAFQGNLRLAERAAAAVLEDAAPDHGPGVALSLLARAWVHVERAEPAPARQDLDRAAEAGLDRLGPWPVVLRLLIEARLLSSAGQAEAALRLLAPAILRERGREPGWLLDLLTLASAEARLQSGEPDRALAAVSPGPATMPLEGAVLAASAFVDLGDVDRAREVLATVTDEIESAAVATQVVCWLVEARVAQSDGSQDRARVLVDRALRTAVAETLRRPFTHRPGWLTDLVDRDLRSRRAHGALLAGLGVGGTGRPARDAGLIRSGTVLIEPLTAREAEVLELLAEMCSTDEIAQELFLSSNTVKTYVRGILRKLCVNRRVDAVRRGRELGLC